MRRVMQWIVVSSVAAFALAVPASAATKNVDVEDSRFVPQTITVTVGDEVVWTQKGELFHTVTSENGAFPRGVLDDTGDKYRHTFNSVGRFPYFCEPHKSTGMTGVVVVEAAQPAPTTPTTGAPATTAPPGTAPTATTAPPNTSATTAPVGVTTTVAAPDVTTTSVAEDETTSTTEADEDSVSEDADEDEDTSGSGDVAGAPISDDDDGGSGATVAIVVIAGLVLLGGGAAAAFMRRRRA